MTGKRSATINEVGNGFTVECCKEEEDGFECETCIFDLIGDATSKALEFLTTDADAPQTDTRPQPVAAAEAEEAPGPTGISTAPPPSGSVVE